jgi:hypothetical protein
MDALRELRVSEIRPAKNERDKAVGREACALLDEREWGRLIERC